MKKEHSSVIYIIVLLIVCTTIEITMYLFGKFYILKSPASYILVDKNITFSQSELADYFSKMDPALGWPYLDSIGTQKYDKTGARPSPAFPEPGMACVSIYGDSFTYGTEVDDNNAWGNTLARNLGCRVSNYGVPGYGTDQAYLRFKANKQDESPIVIMAFVGADLPRIVNQDRRLLWSQHGGLRLKPRFKITDNNKLEIVPTPPITIANASDYLADPGKYLNYEYFLPKSDEGGVLFEFPFSLSVGRSLLNKRFLNVVFGKPSWGHFFDESHDSKALPLLVRIFKSFNETVIKSQKKPLVLILPIASHLKYQLENNLSPVQSLLDRLREERISYFDLSGVVLEKMQQRDICELFTKKQIIGNCGGHYNNEGSQMIADIVTRYLQDHVLQAE